MIGCYLLIKKIPDKNLKNLGGFPFMPILNRKSFNSERNRLTVNSLFFECSCELDIKVLKTKYRRNLDGI